MADLLILLLLQITMLVLSFGLGRILRRHNKSFYHLLPVVVMGKAAGREKKKKMTKLDQNQKNGLNPIDHNNIIIDHAHLIKRDDGDFTIDREKRNQLNDLFIALKSLIPNPTKSDRASIAGDAIVYIHELVRLVRELEFIVAKKKYCRVLGRKMIIDGPSHDLPGEEISSDVTTSWIQRKSKVTEVDVLIIDDKVTIKVKHMKKMINFLLYVSRVLDELQLDLHHVSGCQTRDHRSYFSFNSKIKEGSSVYASTIATKLMEAVDHHAMGNIII